MHAIQITDDRARGNENGRVSSDILNQVLTEDDISDKADEQVHTQSSPVSYRLMFVHMHALLGTWIHAGLQCPLVKDFVRSIGRYGRVT